MYRRKSPTALHQGPAFCRFDSRMILRYPLILCLISITSSSADWTESLTTYFSYKAAVSSDDGSTIVGTAVMSYDDATANTYYGTDFQCEGACLYYLGGSIDVYAYSAGSDELFGEGICLTCFDSVGCSSDGSCDNFMTKAGTTTSETGYQSPGCANSHQKTVSNETLEEMNAPLLSLQSTVIDNMRFQRECGAGWSTVLFSGRLDWCRWVVRYGGRTRTTATKTRRAKAAGAREVWRLPYQQCLTGFALNPAAVKYVGADSYVRINNDKNKRCSLSARIQGQNRSTKKIHPFTVLGDGMVEKNRHCFSLSCCCFVRDLGTGYAIGPEAPLLS